MNEGLADELSRSWRLAPDWRSSFLAAPRYQFIPGTVWLPDPDRRGPDLVPLHRDKQPDRWWELVSGIDQIITQVDDGCPVGPDDVGEIATSSASMPPDGRVDAQASGHPRRGAGTRNRDLQWHPPISGGPIRADQPPTIGGSQ